MPNIIFKLGTLDLSAFVRVNPGEGLDPAAADMLEPAFSDSPFFEGQILTSLHAKNKEQKWPLFLHPSQAPYLQDALNQLVQGINQQLRPIVDQSQTIYAMWQNAQASNPTFYTVQFGRFEPNFNFRQTEKGWLAGVLHLWTLPYGHTATQRSFGTYAAPANQSGLVVQPASMIAAGPTPVGDLSPQFEILTTVGSYLGDDGRLGIIAALPQPSYQPIIPVGSFIGLSPSAIIFGASGAWASQFLAVDSSGASAGAVGGAAGGPGYFSFALSPASVYTGDNRVLGLVRARLNPFGLRAFDPAGNPLGPTVIASAMDGWQLVDYGILRIPPWMGTAIIGVQAYFGIDYSASGMFSPRRAAPAWTKEHGPIFVIPNDSSLLDLDWNSPVLTMDGFDGASGAVLGQDMLGNTWQINTTYGASPVVYDGNSGIRCPVSQAAYSIGSSVNSDFEVETVLQFPAVSASGPLVVIGMGAFTAQQVEILAAASGFLKVVNQLGAFQSVNIPSFVSGAYHLKLVNRASMLSAFLYGPSGAFPGSASGVPLIATISNSYLGFTGGPNFILNPQGGTMLVESFRARILASQGYQPRDILHLHQPNLTNTRANPSAIDVTDLQARQRGPVQAVNLPVPSLGAGMFVASFPWDQGPANDLLNVDIRARERFTYAR